MGKKINILQGWWRSYLNSTGVRCFKDNICLIWYHPSFNIVWFFLPLYSSLINSENITIAMILECYPLSCCHNLIGHESSKSIPRNINMSNKNEKNKKTKYCTLNNQNCQLNMIDFLPSHFKVNTQMPDPMFLFLQLLLSINQNFIQLQVNWSMYEFVYLIMLT